MRLSSIWWIRNRVLPSDLWEVILCRLGNRPLTWGLKILIILLSLICGMICNLVSLYVDKHALRILTMLLQIVSSNFKAKWKPLHGPWAVRDRSTNHSSEEQRVFSLTLPTKCYWDDGNINQLFNSLCTIVGIPAGLSTWFRFCGSFKWFSICSGYYRIMEISIIRWGRLGLWS